MAKLLDTLLPFLPPTQPDNMFRRQGVSTISGESLYWEQPRRGRGNDERVSEIVVKLPQEMDEDVGEVCEDGVRRYFISVRPALRDEGIFYPHPMTEVDCRVFLYVQGNRVVGRAWPIESEMEMLKAQGAFIRFPPVLRAVVRFESDESEEYRAYESDCGASVYFPQDEWAGTDIDDGDTVVFSPIPRGDHFIAIPPQVAAERERLQSFSGLSVTSLSGEATSDTILADGKEHNIYELLGVNPRDVVTEGGKNLSFGKVLLRAYHAKVMAYHPDQVAVEVMARLREKLWSDEQKRTQEQIDRIMVDLSKQAFRTKTGEPMSAREYVNRANWLHRVNKPEAEREIDPLQFVLAAGRIRAANVGIGRLMTKKGVDPAQFKKQVASAQAAASVQAELCLRAYAQAVNNMERHRFQGEVDLLDLCDNLSARRDDDKLRFRNGALNEDGLKGRDRRIKQVVRFLKIAYGASFVWRQEEVEGGRHTIVDGTVSEEVARAVRNYIGRLRECLSRRPMPNEARGPGSMLVDLASQLGHLQPESTSRKVEVDPSWILWYLEREGFEVKEGVPLPLWATRECIQAFGLTHGTRAMIPIWAMADRLPRMFPEVPTAKMKPEELFQFLKERFGDILDEQYKVNLGRRRYWRRLPEIVFYQVLVPHFQRLAHPEEMPLMQTPTEAMRVHELWTLLAEADEHKVISGWERGGSGWLCHILSEGVVMPNAKGFMQKQGLTPVSMIDPEEAEAAIMAVTRHVYAALERQDEAEKVKTAGQQPTTT